MWMYKGKEVKSHDDLLSECTDFVYCITYKSGKKYIGRKTVRSIRKLKPTKKQIQIRKNYSRKGLVNLPFINYKGSSKNTEDEIIELKEILYQCKTKKAATYIECALLFEHDCIFSDEYLNKNISGKFFDNDLDGLL